MGISYYIGKVLTTTEKKNEKKGTIYFNGIYYGKFLVFPEFG